MSAVFYGYIHASSVEQNEARQLIELNRFGILNRNIYMNKLSGKDLIGRNTKNLKKTAGGRLLVIKSIDRPGRTIKKYKMNGGRAWNKLESIRLYVQNIPKKAR